MSARSVAELRDVDGYVRIGDYGVIGDGSSIALVAPDGDIDWWAVPRMDAVPAFAAVLDPVHGGRLSLRPTDPDATVEQRYLRDTNILETVWHTATGTVKVSDALNIEGLGVLPWVELARVVEGVEGRVELQLGVTPGDGLRAWSPWSQRDPRGYLLHAGEVTIGVRASAAVELAVEDPSVTATFTSNKGRTDVIGVIATSSGPLYMAGPHSVHDRFESTRLNWRRWAEHVMWFGDRTERVTRSALLLRMLVMSDTGAIAAAATTSLPEQIGGPKNWDYRFAWVRDAALTIDAMMLCGLQVEAQGCVAWLLDAIRDNGPDLHVMYTLDGAMAPGETDADVPGYRGSRPVRIGNDAVDQIQLGVFGDLFGTMQTWIERGHVLNVPTARQLADLADNCADTWRLPDSGIWELYDLHHYTSSKMNCWRALDVAARLADQGHIPTSSHRWHREADRVRAWIEQNCWSEHQQAYSAYAGTDDLDASVLLGANFGYERGVRMASTVTAIERELAAGPLVYRYTGVHREEQTFTACAFWLVEAMVAVGRRDDARVRLDQLERLASPLGIYSEMITPGSNEQVGNTPQALSHLAYITAAAAVDDVRQHEVDEKAALAARTAQDAKEAKAAKATKSARPAKKVSSRSKRSAGG